MNLNNRRPAAPPRNVFSEYLENEEACIRTERWKFIQCSGRRARNDGYITSNPTPGRYVRLYDQKNDPDELADQSVKFPQVVAELSEVMISAFEQRTPM